MVVRFTRARNEDRPHTFTCVRKDGTTTGMPSTSFFVHHDLTHFAIETTLGYREAFYGLLSQGWDIRTFEERTPDSAKARQLPAEAHYAEILAGLFDLELTSGELTGGQMLNFLRQKCRAAGLPEPAVSPENLVAIRRRREDLFHQWRQLGAGRTLELTFG